MTGDEYRAHFVQEREETLRAEAARARNGEQVPYMWDIAEFAVPLMEEPERGRFKKVLHEHNATLQSDPDRIIVKLPAGTKSSHAVMAGNVPRSTVIFPDGFLIQLEMLPARQWVYAVGFSPETAQQESSQNPESTQADH